LQGAVNFSSMSDEFARLKDKWRLIVAAVLPHEWAFGAFLLVTGVRLLANDASRSWSSVFFASLAAAITMVFWTERSPTPWRWRVRLSAYFVLMGACFYAMRSAVPLLGTPGADSMLLQWDRDLLGDTPAFVWQTWLYPWLENVAMAGYLFFFYYLLAGPGHYCIRDIPLFRKCIVGLFTIYAIALMSYTVFPAAGPHLYMSFQTQLHGPWLLDSTLDAVNRGSNAVDVFPSVHVAASLYLLLFDWRHWRRRFWWVLTPCAVLWWSTMYLRFHYFVDLLAGVAVALAGWWTAQKYEASYGRHIDSVSIKSLRPATWPQTSQSTRTSPRETATTPERPDSR
jgi:membrane-associated phospholipid phosphatase